MDQNISVVWLFLNIYISTENERFFKITVLLILNYKCCDWHAPALHARLEFYWEDITKACLKVSLTAKIKSLFF